MLFPIHIEQYNQKRQWMTWLLIIINTLVFVWQVNSRLPYSALLVVPAKIMENPTSREAFYDVMRSTFMHGSWVHLIGNMLYLHLFGTNVERRIGSVLFLLLYLTSGFAAAYLHVFVFPTSTRMLLGASGAIAGAMGLFIMLFPDAKVNGLLPIGALIYPFVGSALGDWGILLIFFVWPASWSAWIFLALAFASDLHGAMETLLSMSSGIAHFGHLGGFIAGVLFGMVLRLIFLSVPPSRTRKRLEKKPLYMLDDAG